MRPPPAGRWAAARRLAEQVRRRLEPVERMLPVKLPGAAGAPEVSEDPAQRARGGSSPDDGAARLDAARERLRATIEAPEEAGAEHGVDSDRHSGSG